MRKRRATATAGRTRTVAYVRVSTDKQADHRVSLEAQQAKIRAYAELCSLDLVDVIVDAGLSTKTLDRPALSRALGLIRPRTADALLVVKLDRLTRSVRDLGELAEGGKAPFGYRLYGERLAEEADEQAVIREARALRTQGLSLRAVAAKLHDLGFRSRTGRTFAAVQVQRMVAA